MKIDTLITLPLLAFVVVFVIDISGFKDFVVKVASILRGEEVEHLRPFTCSLCLTWWIGIIVLLVLGDFRIGPLAWLALCCALTSPMASLIKVLVAWLQGLADKAATKLGL